MGSSAIRAATLMCQYYEAGNFKLYLFSSIWLIKHAQISVDKILFAKNPKLVGRPQSAGKMCFHQPVSSWLLEVSGYQWMKLIEKRKTVLHQNISLCLLR